MAPIVVQSNENVVPWPISSVSICVGVVGIITKLPPWICRLLTFRDCFAWFIMYLCVQSRKISAWAAWRERAGVSNMLCQRAIFTSSDYAITHAWASFLCWSRCDLSKILYKLKDAYARIVCRSVLCRPGCWIGTWRVETLKAYPNAKTMFWLIKLRRVIRSMSTTSCLSPVNFDRPEWDVLRFNLILC